jgi:hypothetical protein
MSFFELPPRPQEPDEPEDYERPEWMGAPENVLGAAVPIRLVLARTDDLAVAVTDATAYPNGFEFKLVIKARRARHELDDFDPLDFHHPLLHHPPPRRGELPPEFLRFGIEFSDGSKATNLGEPWPAGDPEQAPDSPVLAPGGGGGGGGSWESDYWVWPLPPPGPFAFVCEWPAKGVALTRKEIDAALLRDAAAQAEVLWDEPHGPWPPGGRWTTYGPLRSAPQRKQADSEDA